MAVCYAFLALTLCAFSGLLWQVVVQATPLHRRSTDRNGNDLRAPLLRVMRSLAETSFNESYPKFGLPSFNYCQRWRTDSPMSSYPSFRNQSGQDDMAVVLVGYSCLLRKFTKEDLIERQNYFNDDPVVASLTRVYEFLLVSTNTSSSLQTNASCSLQIADGDETNRNRKNICILKYAADELKKMVYFLEHPQSRP